VGLISRFFVSKFSAMVFWVGFFNVIHVNVSEDEAQNLVYLQPFKLELMATNKAEMVHNDDIELQLD
jgi:hypothetical protein